MPLRSLSSDEALANLKGNPAGQWPAGRDKANRLEPQGKPEFQASFQLVPGEKIFTIGSCFARNVEQALMARGYDCVRLNASAQRLVEQIGADSLNNFGVASIFNDFEWSLNPGAPFEEDRNYHEAAPGRYVDIHLLSRMRPEPLAALRQRRTVLHDLTRQVIDCRVVIITLGLAESWFDTRTGRYLNHTPLKSVLRADPDRFQLHVLDYDTIMDYLRRTLALLRTYCRPDQKILLTVSPVALYTTFTQQDVLVANCYSKSALRAAAEAIVVENDHVDYFPAYESVTLSDRKLAWEDNLHHPHQGIVDLNVSRMIRAYTGEAASAAFDIERAFQTARERYDAGARHEAVRHLEAVADALTDPVHLRFYGELCVRAVRPQEALQVFARMGPDAGGAPRFIWEARAREAIGDAEGAFACAERASTIESGAVVPWKLMATLALKLKRWQEGLIAAAHWIELAPGRTEPVFRLAQLNQGMGRRDAADPLFRESLTLDNPRLAYTHYVRFLLDGRNYGEIARLAQETPPQTPQEIALVEKAGRIAARSQMPAAGLSA